MLTQYLGTQTFIIIAIFITTIWLIGIYSDKIVMLILGIIQVLWSLPIIAMGLVFFIIVDIIGYTAALVSRYEHENQTIKYFEEMSNTLNNTK